MTPGLLAAAALTLLGAALRTTRPANGGVPTPLLLGLWAGLLLSAVAVVAGGEAVTPRLALFGFGFVAASGRASAQLRLSGTTAATLGALTMAVSTQLPSPLVAPAAIGPPTLSLLALLAAGASANLLCRWWLYGLSPAPAVLSAVAIAGAGLGGLAMSGGAFGVAPLALLAPFVAIAVGAVDASRIAEGSREPADERVAATAAAVGLGVAGASFALWMEILAEVPGGSPAPLFLAGCGAVLATSGWGREGTTRPWVAGMIFVVGAALTGTLALGS